LDETLELRGFSFAAVPAGVKRADADRLDFALIAADCPAAAACVTTTNLVAAAPVVITRNRIRSGLCRAVLVNSGNANAYSGEQGMNDALALTAAVAAELHTDPELVVPMSTGVIGHALPMDRMLGRIPELVKKLSPVSFTDAARAIMTTDTRPKTVVRSGELSSGPMRIIGMAKGAGMIAPNMATMLVVILTDVKVEPAYLKECLVNAAEKSFNKITIDGDTSTNDTVVVLSGPRPDSPVLGTNAEDRAAFASLLSAACMDLAIQILRDGEGATKLARIRVTGAPDSAAASRMARTIAESPLVKTAFHGADPNWGRIIAAAGRSGVVFDPAAVDLFIGDVPIVKQGTLVSDDWETAAHKVMLKGEFSIALDLKVGEAEAEILTTDLSEEYVTINADYRS